MSWGLRLCQIQLFQHKKNEKQKRIMSEKKFNWEDEARKHVLEAKVNCRCGCKVQLNNTNEFYTGACRCHGGIFKLADCHLKLDGSIWNKDHPTFPIMPYRTPYDTPSEIILQYYEKATLRKLVSFGFNGHIVYEKIPSTNLVKDVEIKHPENFNMPYLSMEFENFAVRRCKSRPDLYMDDARLALETFQEYVIKSVPGIYPYSIDSLVAMVLAHNRGGRKSLEECIAILKKECHKK